jgi:acyl carrier protein
MFTPGEDPQMKITKNPDLADLLMTGGRLQSIDTLELVLFLEEKCGTNFAERGFDQNELDSVDNIMSSRSPLRMFAEGL